MFLLLSSSAIFAMEMEPNVPVEASDLAKSDSVGEMVKNLEQELKEKRASKYIASQNPPLQPQSSAEFNDLLEECEKLIPPTASDKTTTPPVDTTSQNNDNAKKFSYEFNIYLINNSDLPDEEKEYLYNLTQKAPADTSFDAIVQTFKSHRKYAITNNKSIKELTGMEMLKDLPTFSASDKEPMPQPQPKNYKKIVGVYLGIPVTFFIIGYGIYKLTPYVRKKIKEWKKQTTMQVSATTVPASIATANQMPVLEITHQS
jgi:hypothetical protein